MYYFITSVRLVRACGSKPVLHTRSDVPLPVRLVKSAYGSKPMRYYYPYAANLGQARKSLWIETHSRSMRESERRGQARKSPVDQTGCPYLRRIMLCGQARKSLWIETHHRPAPIRPYEGQARKSLWIKTLHNSDTKLGSRVRLVRACGSKPDASPWLPGYLLVRLVRACGSKPTSPGSCCSSTDRSRLVRACGSKLAG